MLSYMHIAFSAPRKSETTNEIEPPCPPLKDPEVVPRWSTEWPETLTVHEIESSKILSNFILEFATNVNGTGFRRSLQCDHKMQNYAVTQPFCLPDDVIFLSVLLPTRLDSNMPVRLCHQPRTGGEAVLDPSLKHKKIIKIAIRI